MTPALEQHLRQQTREQLEKMLADSREALALAEPHEATSLRAKTVAESNRTMIANIEKVSR